MTRRTTVILGLGATGYSCVRHLAERERLLAFDTRAAAPWRAEVAARYPQVELLAEADWPAALAGADRLIASPGVALTHPLVRVAADAGVHVASDIELFFEACAAPVVGITGTNGKSTVTALVGALARAAGPQRRRRRQSRPAGPRPLGAGSAAVRARAVELPARTPGRAAAAASRRRSQRECRPSGSPSRSGGLRGHQAPHLRRGGTGGVQRR